MDKKKAREEVRNEILTWVQEQRDELEFRSIYEYNDNLFMKAALHERMAAFDQVINYLKEFE